MLSELENIKTMGIVESRGSVLSYIPVCSLLLEQWELN